MKGQTGDSRGYSYRILGLAALLIMVMSWVSFGIRQRTEPPEISGPALVAYLDFDEAQGSGRGSRAQLVFLQSMVRQHEGLQLWVVDTSSLTSSQRKNRAYDWGIAPDRVLALTEKTGRWYSNSTPSTQWLDEDLNTLRSWNTFASAAHLDLALRALD